MKRRERRGKKMRMMKSGRSVMGWGGGKGKVRRREGGGRKQGKGEKGKEGKMKNFT